MGTEAFWLAPEDLVFHGHDLHRPECVLATAAGDLFVSDRRGGVCRIAPDGGQSLIAGRDDLLPNGIALMPDGSFLLANLHGDGGVWRLDRNGAKPFVMEVDGIALEAVNFVCLDARGRVWICANPPLGADGRYNTEAGVGFIAMVDPSGRARIVADGIGWANECLVPARGDRLLINETFGRRLTAFDIDSGGRLSNRRVIARFGAGTYPDGLAEDEEGGIWVVSVASNRLIRVLPDGSQQLVLEDNDPAYIEQLETAYRANKLTRAHLSGSVGRVLSSISSIAFAGPDRRTVYLGSIGGDRLASFTAPVAGTRPVHWDFARS
ncbi:MAG: SMP-30/gluconolactonase/LRE family protein [Flavobacteriaceae bacterium]